MKWMEKGMGGRESVEEIGSPLSSPSCCLRKGALCIWFDCRKLNDVTKECFLLLRIDGTADALAGGKCFSFLDLKSGYWQLAVHPKDKEKTAFLTNQVLWQLVPVPFGLCSTLTTFESLTESGLLGLT
jgi:hypothetical protein